MTASQVSERQVQEAAVEALRLAGFVVLQTTAWRQKGPSGVSPGVPDLLVTHSDAPWGCWLGIEMKRPGGRLTPAQKWLADAGRIVVARSAEDALAAAVRWAKAMAGASPPGLSHACLARAESALAALGGRA